MTKKKKRELTLQEMMIRDAGAGFENLRIVLRQNYEFLANRDVKNFKDLKKFLSKSNITPKEAAAAIARHVRHGSNWTEYQIRRAKSELKWIKTFVAKQKELGTKKLMGSDWLEEFADATGYKIPKIVKTFQNDVWQFKKFSGVERKKDGSFTTVRAEKEFLSRLKNKNRKRRGGRHGR